jgi:hypothetical protein
MELCLLSTDADKTRIARLKNTMPTRRRREVTAYSGVDMPGVYEQYGRSYALFGSNIEEDAAQLVGGFSVHSLDAFAQSYSEPELTGFSASNVFEIGELWFSASYKIRSLLKALLILSGLAQLEGLLIYPTLAPQNCTIEFIDFRRVTDPLRSGHNQGVWVQGMLLHAEDLRTAVKQAMREGFDVHSGLDRISFADAETDTAGQRSS